MKLVIALIALALAGCSLADAPGDSGYVSGDGAVTEWPAGERGAPLEFAGIDFDGEPVDVEDFRGQVVLLNTWYAACPPCRSEAPDLAAVDALAGVQVIGLNGRDDAGTALAFERTFSIEYPSVHDVDGLALASLQGVVPLNAVPTTLVLDAEGRISARIIGRADASTLEALIAAAEAT